MEIASSLSDLLSRASDDARTLALLPPSAKNYRRFYEIHQGTILNDNVDSSSTAASIKPLYRSLIQLDLSGLERFRVEGGVSQSNLRTLAQCRLKDLCDRELVASLKSEMPETIQIGKVLRIYSKKGDEPNLNGVLFIGYRSSSAIYLIGLDYFFLQQIQRIPSFPYSKRKDIFGSYERGDYTFLIDRDTNIIVHPKHWHVPGINPTTDTWVAPFVTDEQEGEGPLSVKNYRGNKLRQYFQRLLNVSFKQNNVDMFRAANLKGTQRILSVAQVFITQPNIKEAQKVFGHVVIGISVEYFEEPIEKYVPYY